MAKSDKRKIEMTRAQQKRMAEQITLKTLTLFIATCMDEFGWTFEDTEKFSVRLKRYKDAVDEHLISINQVKGIIEEQWGVKIDG